MISSTPVVSALGLKAGASTLKPQGNQQGWQEAVFANFRGLLVVQLPKICGNLNFRGSLIRSLMIRKMWKDLSLFFEFRKMSAVLFNLRGICLADITPGFPNQIGTLLCSLLEKRSMCIFIYIYSPMKSHEMVIKITM